MNFDVLLFEPRYEGHHLPWSGMIAQALLGEGMNVRFAHGSNPEQLERFDDAFPGLRKQLSCISVKASGGSSLSELARAAKDCEKVLVPNLDEFASGLFRSSAVRPHLPPPLRNRLYGIYHRPRPLDPHEHGVGMAWKRFGFNRLMKRHPIRGLGLLDEDLIKSFDGPAQWIPDFWRPLAAADRTKAREQFGIPTTARALLFFGISHRRKGLDIAIQAFENCDLGDAFLFIAGRQNLEPSVTRRLGVLVSEGRAIVHDRFINEEDMGAAFRASDNVLVPYRSHYGSSNVLSTAASIGCPVIASDHHLIGRRVKRENLGHVFRDGSSASLASVIKSTSSASVDAAGMERWAQMTSPEAFSKSILSLLEA